MDYEIRRLYLNNSYHHISIVKIVTSLSLSIKCPIVIIDSSFTIYVSGTVKNVIRNKLFTSTRNAIIDWIVTDATMQHRYRGLAKFERCSRSERTY